MNTKQKSQKRPQQQKTISPEQQLLRKMTKRFKAIFQDKDVWSIHSGKWTKLSSQLFFRQQKEITAKTFQLYSNNKSNIIKHLSYAIMINLTSLNLKNNTIESLSHLSSLKAPHLRELYLGDNNITTIKELNKLDCPKLQMISLYANRIQEIPNIYKFNWKNMKLMIIGLNGICDFKPMAKCRWDMVEKISVQNNRYVKNYNLQKWSPYAKVTYG